MKIRLGDSVAIISGKDKGKTGTVIRVLPKEARVVVEGMNIRTKHVKKTFQQAGRILKFEGSIDVSKVMIIDPKDKKPSRVGYKMDGGKKMRISKLSGETVVKAKMKKEAKKTEVKKESKKDEPEVAGAEKTPFWKRMKFGSTAADVEGADVAHTAGKDHSIPSSTPIRKAAGRGK